MPRREKLPIFFSADLFGRLKESPITQPHKKSFFLAKDVIIVAGTVARFPVFNEYKKAECQHTHAHRENLSQTVNGEYI